MPTKTPTRPRGRPGGGRERILDVACELISSQGMDDVRVARIARAAGVSTALVHYHFATREAGDPSLPLERARELVLALASREVSAAVR